MTQMQLDRAVAAATGESLRTIHHLGFSDHAGRPADLEPEDLCLTLDCPFCGAAVPAPGRRAADRLDFAECPRCDVAFDFADDEVYAAPAGRAA